MGETNTKLDFSNSELGNYYYELNLKATPAGPERALYFRTCLGQSQVQVGKFLNFAKQKTDYSCKVCSLFFFLSEFQEIILCLEKYFFTVFIRMCLFLNEFLIPYHFIIQM